MPVNQIIKQALHPYPDSWHIVTKVGALRDAEGGWPTAFVPEQLRQGVHDNLDNLGLDVLDVVNARVGVLTAPLLARSPNRSPHWRSCSKKG